MIRIKLSGNFNETLRLMIKDNPNALEDIGLAIKLLQNNPSDTRLHNHLLRKRLEGRWAFSVTDDIRIIYRCIGKNEVRFLAIGTHTKVYRMRSRT